MSNFLFGVLISSVLQVAEVEPFSNAVSFMPEDHLQVTEYLNEIDNRMVPVIIINDFYRQADGKFYHTDSAPLKQALADSSHFGRIVFMWDEPLMHAYRSGQAKMSALAVMRQVKADFPGVEFAHIEAYSEIYRQFIEDYGNLTLFYDADHIGFDCYGKFSGCGGPDVPEIPQMIYLATIHNAIKNNNSSAKVFLVPGAFKHENHFPTEMDAINQLQEYYAVWANNKEHVSGMGLFTWGNIQHIVGASNNGELSDYIQTMLHTIKEEASYRFPE